MTTLKRRYNRINEEEEHHRAGKKQSRWRLIAEMERVIRRNRGRIRRTWEEEMEVPQEEKGGTEGKEGSGVGDVAPRNQVFNR